MTRKAYYDSVKNYRNYTEQQILDIVAKARNRYEYDYLIDRLYIYDPSHYNTRSKDEYSILTARQYHQRQRMEIYERPSADDDAA
jgi:hypothetical protein